jgi:hypothetical protein
MPGLRLLEVHIGDTVKRYDPRVIHHLLPMLDEGDILTHYFTANPGGGLDANGKLVPEARDAERGGWLDTAHGRMNFSFDVGRRCIDQGLLLSMLRGDREGPAAGHRDRGRRAAPARQGEKLPPLRGQDQGLERRLVITGNWSDRTTGQGPS